MDPIANMFSQIYNAQHNRQKNIKIPYSKIKIAILAILKENKKIADFKEKFHPLFNKNKNNRQIEISLLGEMLKINRISRPGKRVYSAGKNIPQAKTYNGLVIVSTSEGVMTGKKARQKGLGGEVLAEVD